MSVLITGGDGTVGRTFQRLRSRFREELDFVGREALDITDRSQVFSRLEAGRYAMVINLAADTDLDRCERDPAQARRTNLEGAENLALAAKRFGAKLVQISTVGIFGAEGGTGPYSERDAPAPVNVYARTKAEAEAVVSELLPDVLIVRTAWLMGGGLDDKKFVGKIRQKLLAKEPVVAADDQLGSPTYVSDLIEGLKVLIEREVTGIVHLTNSGRATRFSMALELKRLLGSKSEIRAVKAEHFPLTAPRPRSEVSLSLVLPALGLSELMRPWPAAMAAYVASWANG